MLDEQGGGRVGLNIIRYYFSNKQDAARSLRGGDLIFQSQRGRSQAITGCYRGLNYQEQSSYS